MLPRGAYRSIMERQTMHQDPVDALQTAFGIFDAEGNGTVDTTELRSVIGNLGERFSQEESMLSSCLAYTLNHLLTLPDTAD